MRPKRTANVVRIMEVLEEIVTVVESGSLFGVSLGKCGQKAGTIFCYNLFGLLTRTTKSSPLPVYLGTI